ncbi:CsbD family protein [Pararhodospirillum photometricum]|uniref:CsbD n=1 Tax=Pararhodospirillum photometricum DSM 122 TaxID=1150469 RepID=H6SL19_PARPM|nr:CsbD family protein [Pararhodospirillum photometricum]CCG08684.1 CsbD [Pararhodospirillum photometricum DSM 122]
MDKDRIVGSAKQIKGSIEEALGKVLGDAKLEEDGRADQAEGKAQNIAGGLKDSDKE